MQEAADSGETDVDEVLGKFIKSRQSYDISFQLGVVISYEDMKQDFYSKDLNLTYLFLFQETEMKVSTS